MISNLRAATTALALAASFEPAQAHITLEAPAAPADSIYRAVFRVPHGCGTAATIRVRVQIPDGVRDVRPMPKPGWQLSVVTGPLAQPYSDGHGGMVTQGVREVSWSGGHLPNEFYDEFVMRLRTPAAPGTTIWFPIVQDCEGGAVTRWIEIPAAGRALDDYRTPAAPLRLTPAP